MSRPIRCYALLPIFLATSALAISYDCGQAPMSSWPKDQETYCCLAEGIGCPGFSGTEAQTPAPPTPAPPTPTPTFAPIKYDCFMAPSMQWPAAKRRWCCDNAKLGCETITSTSTSITVTTVPQGCETVCSFKGKITTCRAKISQALNDAFYQDPHGCALARELTLQVCPVCHVCTLGSLHCVDSPLVVTTTTLPSTLTTTTTSWTTITMTTTIPSRPTATSTTSSLTTSSVTKTSSTTLFNCQAGLTNWKIDWSTAKQSWCCSFAGLGCIPSTTTSLPYDCEADLSNWKNAWSHAKKSWCCEHNGHGCPETTTETTTTLTTTVPDGCGTICSFKGKSLSCKQLIDSFETDQFHGVHGACPLAVNAVHQHCPGCSLCTASRMRCPGMEEEIQEHKKDIANNETNFFLVEQTVDWTPFERNLYFLVDKLDSWDAQSATCGKLGAHMVAINSAAENAFVSAMMPKPHGAADGWQTLWIGLNKVSFDGWIDGSRMGYHHWAYGQPLNQSSGQQAKGVSPASLCGEISVPAGNRWYTNDCLAEARTVCEIDAAEVPSLLDNAATAITRSHDSPERTKTASSTTRTPSSSSATTKQLLKPEDDTNLFDCRFLHPSAWQNASQAKQSWCCERYDLRFCSSLHKSADQEYDCGAGLNNWHAGWSTSKIGWCCSHATKVIRQHLHKGHGCPTTFDCHVGVANWKDGWSKAKKAWCCENEGFRCDAPAPVRMALKPFNCDVWANPSNWSHDHRTWCCRNNNIGCPTTTTTRAMFDCDFAYKSWKLLWSFNKRKWCCAQEKRGCAETTTSAISKSQPFDCLAGYSNSEEGWSSSKKAWCCQMAGKGCVVATGALRVQADPLRTSDTSRYPYDCAEVATTQEPWSVKKRVWCCRTVGRGCPSTTTVGYGGFQDGLAPEHIRVLLPKEASMATEAARKRFSRYAAKYGAVPFYGSCMVLGASMGVLLVLGIAAVVRKRRPDAEQDKFHRLPMRDTRRETQLASRSSSRNVMGMLVEEPGCTAPAQRPPTRSSEDASYIE